MPYSDSPSLRLRRLSLTSPPPISRRLILPQAHGQIFHPPTACRMTVSCSFSLPCMGFFFTFPSRYFFTIGHPGVFSLTRWSSPIHTGFHVPHATRDKGPVFYSFFPCHSSFRYWTFTIYGAGFSCFSYTSWIISTFVDRSFIDGKP